MFDTPFPEIQEAPAIAPAPRTEVATTTAGAIDLAKIDMAAVVRAQFGPWRETTAKLKAENAKTVLDLSTQSKVNEAKSLRERTINTPVAEARKTCKALKSMLAGASATAGEEVDALVLGYTEAAEPITKQIDAAQARIDAEKAEKARIEREAQERHTARLQVIASYLTRCQEPGMTAERIQKGMDALCEANLDCDNATQAVELAAAQAKALESMRTLHAQTVAREAEAARQEAIRLENERVAAELAAERARIAAEAEAIRRASAELAAQQEAARREAQQAEAKRIQMENDAAAALRTSLVPAQELTLATAPPCHQTIVPDDPEAAPPMTAEEMGAERPDVQDAIGLDEVNPEPADFGLVDPLPWLQIELSALAAEARASRFPTQPKMGLEWWTRFYALADAEVAA